VPAAPHLVIVGGGFGGLYAAQALARADMRVTLVDRRNHHLFSPLLYQVATAGLSAPDIATPIRSVLRRQKNVTVLLASVTAIDAARRIVVTDRGPLAYDALILAPGTTHSYFGHDDWAPFAPGLKDVEDAFEIRRRVLIAFENAEQEPDEARRRAWLTFAIVGAGPTGVELAGALEEIAQRTLAKDFRNFDPASARVVLIDAAPRVLNTFSEHLSALADAILRRRGVELLLGRRVTGIDARGVAMGETRIEARTVLWAAGVQASPLGAALGVPLDRAGRVLVTPDLSIPGHPEVFVVGDLCALEQDGEWLPGVAQPAIQEGQHAAKNALRMLAGEPTRPFRYVDKGIMATIGRAAAVARVGKFEFGGLFAWLLWVGIHIWYLIGFRNRLVVMLEWGWAYFSFARNARVIMDRSAMPPDAPQPVAESAPAGTTVGPPG
jgi:NADH:ubiquinone reductase (H+-translocating)